MPTKEAAYLGPAGTYSHLVAEKRFGKTAKLIPKPTIHDICMFASSKNSRYGIVPIENSSGGAIYETVDILLANKPKVHIIEELALNVKLALIGNQDKKIHTLYSHFAPIEHCAGWIRKNLPRVKKQVVASTAAAAILASKEDGAAALGSRRLASYYDMKVLKYPVESDVPNITTFLVISGKKTKTVRPTKTTVAARLYNEPGSLCRFLEYFRDHGVNLSRLISRPIRGSHKEYAFLVDLEGGAGLPAVKKALSEAKKTSAELRVVGQYPTGRKYTS